jgi:hypothetical protein
MIIYLLKLKISFLGQFGKHNLNITINLFDWNNKFDWINKNQSKDSLYLLYKYIKKAEIYTILYLPKYKYLFFMPSPEHNINIAINICDWIFMFYNLS